jgi:hypothetical protein
MPSPTRAAAPRSSPPHPDAASGVPAVTPEAIKNLSTAMGLQRDDFRFERRSGAPDRGNVDRDQLMTISAIRLNQPVDVIFRLENLSGARPRPLQKP